MSRQRFPPAFWLAFWLAGKGKERTLAKPSIFPPESFKIRVPGDLHHPERDTVARKPNERPRNVALKKFTISPPPSLDSTFTLLFMNFTHIDCAAQSDVTFCVDVDIEYLLKMRVQIDRALDSILKLKLGRIAKTSHEFTRIKFTPESPDSRAPSRPSKGTPPGGKSLIVSLAGGGTSERALARSRVNFKPTS